MPVQHGGPSVAPSSDMTDGNQDLRPRRRNTGRRGGYNIFFKKKKKKKKKKKNRQGGPAEEQGGGDVGTHLGQGAVLVRALQRPGRGCGPVPTSWPARVQRAGTRRAAPCCPGPAEFLRRLSARRAGMGFLDADRVVAFPARSGPCAGTGEADAPPGRVATGRVGCVGVRGQPPASRAFGSARVKVGGLVHHDPRVLPRNCPSACRGRRGSTVSQPWRRRVIRPAGLKRSVRRP